MKYLIISEKGEYLPIAIRLKEEGKDVYLYIIDHTRRNKGRNLVPVVDSYNKLSYDIAILDVPNPHPIARRLTGKVFAQSDFTDLFQKDKKYFMEICSYLNIPNSPDATPDNGIEGWFNGKRFVLPIFYHKYYTRLFNDNIGDDVQIGYTGVISNAKHEFDKRYKASLGTLEETLKEAEYKGPIRLDYKGNVLCKPSTRLIVPTLFELLDMSFSALIEKTVRGELGYIKTCREKAVALRISIAPFPYCCKFFWGHGYYQLEGKPLYEYNPNQMKHLWPLNVFKGGNGTISSSGHSGDLGYVTSRMGVLKKNREAKRRITRTIKNLGIDNLQYRTDIP